MVKWDDELYIFTLEEYEQLPNGIELYSITGESKIKGKDFIFIDGDIRFGHMAYGVKNPWSHELKDLFLIFKLKD